MDLRRNDNTDHLWKTFENSIEEAEALLTKNSTSILSDEVLPVTELSELEAFKAKVIAWQNATAYYLRLMFKDQTVADTCCPIIEDVDLMSTFQPEAIAQLKASLTERLKSLKSLISEARQTT